MESTKLYDAFAALFGYPAEDYRERVARCAAQLAPDHPELAARIDEFAENISGLSTETLQELYIQTFDLNPVCSLEVGWHLFGENYDRGTFLVRMRGLLRRFELAESEELPDHLSHVLAVLGRMPAEEAEEFVVACVFPALEKMRAGFKEKENSFTKVLDALTGLLTASFGDALLEASPAYPELRVLNRSGLR